MCMFVINNNKGNCVSEYKSNASTALSVNCRERCLNRLISTECDPE